ncbi:MAG: metal-sulfur cluster assembly factor [Acidimicrobiales bacterium]
MTTGVPGGANDPGTPVDVGSWLRLSARDLVDGAWDALRGVYDPELYLDVVSLGLVYDVRAEDSAVVVEMTMTTPGCPASEVLPEMARAAIADAVDGAVEVDVRVVWDPPWSPAMIDEDAARALGFRAR